MTFFFFFFLWKLFISLFLPPLSPPFSLSLSVSLQGPHAAINFNTWCSNRCSLELCTHTQQAGNKDSPPPSLQPFNLKKKKKKIRHLITYQQKTHRILNDASIFPPNLYVQTIQISQIFWGKNFPSNVRWCWMKLKEKKQEQDAAPWKQLFEGATCQEHPRASP